GEIAGELGIGTFHHVACGIEAEIAFDHDLRTRWHVEVDGLAFYQLDRRAPDGAHHVVLAHALGHRCAARESERGLPADRHRDRHFRAAAVLPGGDMVADMLRAPHQDRDPVVAGDHAPIDADIHDPLLG